MPILPAGFGMSNINTPTPDQAMVLIQEMLRRNLPQGGPPRPPTPSAQPPPTMVTRAGGGDRMALIRALLENMLRQGKQFPGMEVPGASPGTPGAIPPGLQAPPGAPAAMLPYQTPMPTLPSAAAPGTNAPSPSLMSLLSMYPGNLPSGPPGDVSGTRMGRP